MTHNAGLLILVSTSKPANRSVPVPSDTETLTSVFYHFRVGAVVEFHGFLLHISNGSVCAQRQRDKHDTCTQHTHSQPMDQS